MIRGGALVAVLAMRLLAAPLAADGVLYIADAQSHSIRALDLTGLTVSTLPLKLSSAGR